MTVNDLITASLRRLRVISGSDPADGDSINDALLRFNDWIDSLKLQDFLIFARVRVTWNLVPGKASYLIGGDVDAERPTSQTSIQTIGYVDPTGAEYPVTLLGDDAYAAIPQKSVLGAVPSYWFYNPTFPAGTLIPWPIPNTPGMRGVIYVGQMTSEFTINQTLVVPPGYRRYLREGLALELAAEFHVADPAVLGPIRAAADEALRDIKRKNRRLRDLTPPVEFTSGRAGSNIYTGP